MSTRGELCFPTATIRPSVRRRRLKFAFKPAMLRHRWFPRKNRPQKCRKIRLWQRWRASGRFFAYFGARGPCANRLSPKGPWHKGLYNCRTSRQAYPLQLLRSLLFLFSVCVNLPHLRIQNLASFCHTRRRHRRCQKPCFLLYPPLNIASARRFNSSGSTSSLCVANIHVCPEGSSSLQLLSP